MGSLINRRFSAALFRMHQAYNLLDLNLGLCIRFLEHPEEVERSHTWLASSNVAQKIDRFSSLATEYLPAKDVRAWTVRAHNARRDRNLYTHAYFRILSEDEDREQPMEVHPWMRSKLGVADQASMSIAAFESIAEEAEAMLKELMQLQTRAGI